MRPSTNARLIAGLGALFLLPIVLHAQLNVLTNRYDSPRTGANLSETKLTTANVNVGRFAKLYSLPVDGAVYAQPLYVKGVTIGTSVRNVLYVATMNDKVYAFDADSPSTAPLWQRDFTSPPAVTPVPITDIVAPDRNIVGNVGIQGTPVIDLAGQTLYLVARTKESSQYVQRFHAMSITTGQERAGSPVTITGSVPGKALDGTGSVVTFDPKVHVQRAGLALTNGVVLVAWAAHEDVTPSHGWLMGFDASSLAPVSVFAVTPDAYLGGIWQGGRAPAIDGAGNVYVATGNGKWDGVRNFGNSVLKFAVSRSGLTLLDYFTPANEADLTAADDDLSGSGFTLLPGTDLLLGGGKEGVLYLLNKDSLGHKLSGDTQVVQKMPVNGGHVMGGPVYWNSSAGALVYNWSENDVIKSYRLSSGLLSAVPYAQGSVVSPGHPGGSLTLSANASVAHTGIVWASMPTSQDGMHGRVAGILRAYDAETLAEIWNSDQNASRDRLGTLMKFVPPVVVNGRVYLPNQDNQIAVYGLLPSDFAVSVAPGGRVISPGTSATFSVTVSGQAGFADRVDLSATGQPSGTTISFSPSSVTGSGVVAMTVTVPATATTGSFWLDVRGTSGATIRQANPVVVNVNTTGAGLGAISVDFVGSSSAVMGADETAGVSARARWNSAAGAVRTSPLLLTDETGTPTGATITWNASGVWQTPVTDQSGNRRMMKGYLDTTSTSVSSLTIAGLTTRSYDIYVYVDGDNSSYTRTGEYTISGAGITTTTLRLTDAAGVNFSSAFVQAADSSGNYLKFRINAGGFVLTATPGAASTGTRRAPLNGIQIIPVAAPPAAISVDFVGGSTVVMGATETAGVVSASRWNNAIGAASSTALPLVDETGAATKATLTWSASGTWATPILDAPGNLRMMKGYLDTTSTSATSVTVVGLTAGTYNVYVYGDGDNRSYTRTAVYAMSGPGITTTAINLTDAASVNFESTFTQASESAGNYVKFTITGSGFTLTATPGAASTATRRAPVNGIQIVPVM